MDKSSEEIFSMALATAELVRNRLASDKFSTFIVITNPASNFAKYAVKHLGATKYSSYVVLWLNDKVKGMLPDEARRYAEKIAESLRLSGIGAIAKIKFE
jgi:hypothetical protein